MTDNWRVCGGGLDCTLERDTGTTGIDWKLAIKIKPQNQHPQRLLCAV